MGVGCGMDYLSILSNNSSVISSLANCTAISTAMPNDLYLFVFIVHNSQNAEMWLSYAVFN